MRKFLNVILCTCMLLNCVPISAMAMTADATAGEATLAQIDENTMEGDESNIALRNVDYVQLKGSNNYMGTFYVRRGENVKVHMYIESFKGLPYPIQINFKKGNGAYKVVGIWTGTGHKYADLCINCQNPGYYSIWIEGAFSGSGAVYREP